MNTCAHVMRLDSRKAVVGVMFAMTLGLTPSVASALTFFLIQFPGATETVARGINDRGEVVGSFTDETGEHGFFLKNGVFARIAVPGAISTSAFGINRDGQIVGSFEAAGGHHHGFFLANGSFNVQGAVGTAAYSINNSSLDDGVFVLIDVTGATFTAAFGMNSRGDIVGATTIGGRTYGFLSQ
jgi:probable HAF family extracellular repeat protein